jgi:hypothetical protein
MFARAVLVGFLWFAALSAHAANPSECKTEPNPSVRLKCYDDANAQRQPIKFERIVDQVLETPAAIAAIAAALLALVSGIAGPIVQLKIGKRQARAAQTAADASMATALNAGNREIARMRLSWMDKLRDVLSEFHSILMSTEDPESSTNAQRLSQLGTQIDLLLNQEDRIQKVLWDVSDKIYKAESLAERQSYDTELIMAGRAVFKAEWEKIKAEMRGEPFQTGE